MHRRSSEDAEWQKTKAIVDVRDQRFCRCCAILLPSEVKQQEELTHRDCAILVHLPLFDLPISEMEYVREICGYIKEHDCIPQDEKNTIIPAMYLNIGYFIESEYEQEKLLEAINMLKYCENGLDRERRLAREDAEKKLSENIARNLLRDNQDVDYVHRMTGLSVFRIRELKANL